MKNLKFQLGIGFVLFLLFFGMALLEVFQSHDWVRATFWVAMGIVFIVLDNVPKRASRPHMK